MYLPPVLRPVAAGGPATPAVQRLAEAPFSVVRGLPGSYVAERLAGVIDSWQRLGDCVWLRAIDARPADLAQALGAACHHRWAPGRSEPEPMGLPYVPVSRQIEAAPEGAVIVLELGGRVTGMVSGLVRAIRPVITDRHVRLVVVAESRFHPPVHHGPDCVVPATDLLDRGALEGMLSARNRTRLLRYAGRRTAVLGDVLAAAQLWSQDAVTEALESARGLSSLLGRLTAVLVDQLTPDQRSALEVALTMGYWHPQMGARPVAPEQLRPWLVPMEQQWGWVRPIWMPSLRRELSRTTVSGLEFDGGPRRAVAAIAPAKRAATHRGLLEARLIGSLEVRIDG